MSIIFPVVMNVYFTEGFDLYLYSVAASSFIFGPNDELIKHNMCQRQIFPGHLLPPMSLSMREGRWTEKNNSR